METRVLGRYELLGELGKGGMGVVYRARHTQLGKIVALKILPRSLAQNPTPLARFVREARAAASLDHPNIVQVFDVDQADDTHFFAMEFVEGETLGHRIQTHGTIPVAETIFIARQIADALAFAHERGVVHRDLKPSNIMLAPGRRVKVMDFGIAAAAGGENLTLTGEILGTPSYMSPEQALGKDVDGRSDLFSLGVTLCEMLTGRAPLHGLSVVSAVGKLIQPGQELEVHLPPDVPPGLRAIVTRLVRKNPEMRYGSAAELIADLGALERVDQALTVAARGGAAGAGADEPAGAGVARGDSAERAKVFPRFARQHRLEFGSAVLIVAAVALLLWGRNARRGGDGVEVANGGLAGASGDRPAEETILAEEARGEGAPAEAAPTEAAPPQLTPAKSTPTEAPRGAGAEPKVRAPETPSSLTERTGIAVPPPAAGRNRRSPSTGAAPRSRIRPSRFESGCLRGGERSGSKGRRGAVCR